MDNVALLAKQLNEALLNSPLYQEYLESKQAIENNVIYRDLVVSFKRAQMEFELKRLKGQAVTEDEEMALLDQYSDISLNDECEKFLKDENEMLSLVRELTEIITNRLDMDLSI